MTATRFETLELAEPLLRAIREAGFTHCTPIQAETLPIALAGRDVAGQARTGTGKTAAYLVALFQRLLTNPPAPERRSIQPRALIVAPTRELAVQIHRDAEALGKYCGFKLGLIYGGEAYGEQRDMLAAGVDVLIGTPGRLIDYFKQRVFNLKAAEVLVLDEADRMFDMGFIKDIRFLLRRLPPPEKRLSMLFSATLSYRVLELAYEYLDNAESVAIEPEKVTVDTVHQTLYMPATREKINLLIGLLRRIDPKRAMVFINTKRMAERLAAYLEGNGFKADVLSGDVRQKKRLHLLRRFEGGELPVLVTTDVASRGLHIPDVSHVFNFDLPQDAEDYVHRIGRTARAGAAGEAISFACEQYAFSLPDIEAFIGYTIPKAHIEKNMLAEVAPPAQRRTRRREHDKPRRRRRRGR